MAPPGGGVPASPVPDLSIRHDGKGGEVRQVRQLMSRPVRVNVFLRSAALLFSLAACLLLRESEQNVVLTIFHTQLSKTARYNVAPVLVYFVYCTAASAVYSFVLLVHTACNGARNGKHETAKSWFIFLADQALTYVLLSVNVASMEFGYLTKNGIEQFGWMQVCTTFHRFCTRDALGIALGLFASLALALSSCLSAYSLFAL